MASSSRETPLVSVIIVNYNGQALLRDCVGKVLASSVPVEVFVADNGSVDDSLELLRAAHGEDTRLRIHCLKVNLGFARASNSVLSETRGEYLLFLNPDCFVRPDTLRIACEALAAKPRAGMAGALVRNLDGSEQAGSRRSVPTPWRSLVRVLHLNRLFPHHPRFQDFILTRAPLPTEPVSMEGVSGAFMLIKRAALETVGPLDEGYFLHCEDLDWFMRFRAAGWDILFVPGAEVSHVKGACSQGEPVRVLWHKHRGMVRFYRKFFRRRYGVALMWLVIAAVWLRFSLLLPLSFASGWRRMLK